MLRALGVVGAAGGAAYIVASGGQLGGFDLTGIPLALLIFCGISAAVLYTLRHI
jgi:hypothetical protein